MSCDHKEQKQKACHEDTGHEKPQPEHGGKNDLKQLARTRIISYCEMY